MDGGSSERRVVTILFADIAGFTAISERLDPETVTDAMNDIFGRLGRAVEAVGGHVDKVIGDSMMALFGAPVAHEDDAVRAVRAALSMHRVIRERDAHISTLLGQPIRLRIGIHTGLVVWGSVGPPGQARPTVMGDAVNLASRLQRAAPEGGVLVSEAVYRQARGAFLGTALEPLVVKGKSEPVAVYEIVGEREHAEPVARPPFVDREDELALLLDLQARAQRGRSQALTVLGDPGVGKTRLAEEFIRRLPAEVRVLQAACAPYGGASLGPLADLFRQLADLHGPVTVRDVEARVPFPDRARQAAVVLCRLFGLADVPDEGDVPHDTALLVAAEAIRRMLTRPTAVLIEDLQWADAGTLELLPYIVDRMSDAPLLLICTLRPDAPAIGWGRRTALTAVHLEPMSDADARAFVAGVLGQNLPDAVERALVAKAGGNPFYLNEIIATLSRAGTLARDDRGRWRATGSVEDVLPDTIHTAVLARLDRLPPDLRVVLQRAAVVGASFAPSLVAEISPDLDVPGALRALEDADLVRRRDPLAIDAEHDFVHPLVREVAYNSLLGKLRTAIHLQIAESLERGSAAGHGQAKAIGTHFARGGSPERALPYLVKAGRAAADRYAAREAINLLEWARQVAQESGQTAAAIAVCEDLGELYLRVQERGPKAWFETWDFVRAHVDPATEPARRARAAVRAASALISDNRTPEARTFLREAEALIPPDDRLWSEYHSVRAHALIMESEYRQALDAAREGVRIADQGGSLEERSRAYAQLAHPAILPLLGDAGRRMMQGWMAEVARSGDERLSIQARHFLISDVWTRGLVDQDLLRTAEEALGKAQEYGWTRDEAVLCMLLGWAEFLVGRWPEAAQHIARGHQLIEEHGGRMQGLFTILMPFFRGNLAMAAGRLEEARAIFEDALSQARFHAPIWLNHDLARCLVMLGDAPGAEAAMRRSLESSDRLRCVICGCQANGIAAEFYADRGDATEAERLAREAESVARDVGHVLTLTRVARARARLALRTGAHDLAVSLAQEAEDMGRRMPMRQPFELGQSLVVLGDACRPRGDRERAAAAWQEARALFAELGAQWHVRTVEERARSVRAS
jgi:adenylate cyclase